MLTFHHNIKICMVCQGRMLQVFMLLMSKCTDEGPCDKPETAENEHDDGNAKENRHSSVTTVFVLGCHKKIIQHVTCFV